MIMSPNEIANNAIRHALRALRQRHLVEEGAHAPAFLALSRPIISQVSCSLWISFWFQFPCILISSSLIKIYLITTSRCCALSKTSSPCSDYFRSFDSMNIPLCLGMAFMLLPEFGMERESREAGVGASAMLQGSIAIVWATCGGSGWGSSF